MPGSGITPRHAVHALHSELERRLRRKDFKDIVSDDLLPNGREDDHKFKPLEKKRLMCTARQGGIS